MSLSCLLGATAALGLAVHHVGGGDLLAGLRGFSAPALLRSGAGVLLVLEFGGFLAAAVAWRAGTRGPLWLGLGVVLVGEGVRNYLHAVSGGWGIALITSHLGAAALWVGALVHVVRVARHGKTVPAYAGGTAAWLRHPRGVALRRGARHRNPRGDHVGAQCARTDQYALRSGAGRQARSRAAGLAAGAAG